MTLSSVLLSLGGATPTPTNFEIDLVFPRNDTYRPIEHMPVVFAVHNPELFHVMNATIEWELWKIDPNLEDPWMSPNVNNTVGGVIRESNYVSSSISTGNPSFVGGQTCDLLNGVQGTWVFKWSLQIGSCALNNTQLSYGYPSIYALNNSKLSYDNSSSFTVFTTSENASSFDLEAAAAGCPQESFAYNVTRVAGIGESDATSDYRYQCAILGASPMKNPCAATINATTASEVSAFMKEYSRSYRSPCRATTETPIPSTAEHARTRLGFAVAALCSGLIFSVLY